MYQDIFTLKWKFFIPNISSSLSDVFTENIYSDVTLVSDDKIPFYAHKYVLSASSPVFKNILLDNPQSHPLIYLRGVKHQELESILQFIYLGEAEFYRGSMNNFIQAAKDLKIKLLAETILTGNTFPTVEDFVTNDNKEDILAEEDAEYINVADEVSSHEIPAHTPGINDLGPDKHLYTCGKTFQTSTGWSLHIRSKHEKIVFSCHHCKYKATTQGNLKTHIEAVHKGIKYFCNHCEYQATTKVNLKNHQQIIHEGLKYSCTKCRYQATAQSNLKKHKKSVHEGVKYSCDECEYRATQQSHLKTHKKSVHEGVKYSCNQCEYQATRQNNLKTHKKAAHEGLK